MQKICFIAQSTCSGYQFKEMEVSDNFDVDDFLKHHPYLFRVDKNRFVCEYFYVQNTCIALSGVWRVFIDGVLYYYSYWDPCSCTLEEYFSEVKEKGTVL